MRRVLKAVASGQSLGDLVSGAEGRHPRGVDEREAPVRPQLTTQVARRQRVTSPRFGAPRISLPLTAAPLAWRLHRGRPFTASLTREMVEAREKWPGGKA